MSTLCSHCYNVISLEDEFCNICIAPINVSKISDFSSEEHLTLLTALLNVLSEGSTFNQKIKKREYLKDYLNCFWLRPETAMYMSAEYISLKKLNAGNNLSINVDIGCGDGIHTSILNGWSFKEKFDAFENINFNGKDIFDSQPSTNKEKLTSNNGRFIDMGIDIKSNSIDRAKILGTFKDFKCMNIVQTSFQENYKVAFSNLIRDFKDNELDMVFENLKNLLANGAELYFSSPTEHFRDNLYFYPKIQLELNEKRRSLINKLNRGRSNFSYQQINLSAWAKKLKKHNFDIEDVSYFGSSKFTRFWDTGLRGFTHFFKKAMESKTKLIDKVELKKIFVRYWYITVNDILDNETYTDNNSFQMIKARLRK